MDTGVLLTRLGTMIDQNELNLGRPGFDAGNVRAITHALVELETWVRAVALTEDSPSNIIGPHEWLIPIGGTNSVVRVRCNGKWYLPDLREHAAREVIANLFDKGIIYAPTLQKVLYAILTDRPAFIMNLAVPNVVTAVTITADQVGKP